MEKYSQNLKFNFFGQKLVKVLKRCMPICHVFYIRKRNIRDEIKFWMEIFIHPRKETLDSYNLKDCSNFKRIKMFQKAQSTKSLTFLTIVFTVLAFIFLVNQQGELVCILKLTIVQKLSFNLLIQIGIINMINLKMTTKRDFNQLTT